MTAPPEPLRHPPARLERRPRKAGAGRVLPNFINLCGDYRFLRGGYWALIDSELNGVASTPTPLQAVTAQNAASCLMVAERHGIRCVDWGVARKPEDIQPPSLLVPVAGLTGTSYVARTARSAATQLRRASQNGTRSVLTVRMEGALRSMKTVVGLTTHDQYQLSWSVWRAFGIPLSTVWFLEGEPSSTDALPPARFLGIDPLPLHELSERELTLLEEVSQRPMSQS